MDEFLKKVSGHIQEFIKSLSAGRRISLIVISALIVAVLIGIFMWAGYTSYVPLMTNLNGEDANNIVRFLREKRIPFRVDPSGRNISIPPENVYELRLELATMGLPQSGVVGYELFDKQTLGTTSFVQKINQKRAQEGELVRTINTIKGVRRSRVHLAIPQKSAFLEDQKNPTASVVLDLEPGTILTDKQVYGIGNLVARAVEGLDVPDVVIMNSDGKILSKNNSDPLAAATASQLDFEEKLEGDFERRIVAILSPIAGEGHVAAKVSADLDFSQVNETQTMYDADGSAVRSVEKRSDSMNGVRPGPYGLAGNSSNAPGQPPQANGEVKKQLNQMDSRRTQEMFQANAMDTLTTAAFENRAAREMQSETGQTTEQAQTNSGKSFVEILKDSFDKVNVYQNQADLAIKELIAGRNKNIHETMLTIERADTSLKLMMQVRNKILDAYREIMRMQV